MQNDLSFRPPYFHPLRWLSNAHAQTITPTFFRVRPHLQEQWERVELPDGDFLDLVWNKENAGDKEKPLVVLLHGLGGSIRSHYIPGLMKALSKHQLRPVLMHFRGCSGEPNRLTRSYHSGDTQDLAFIVDYLKGKLPSTPIFAVGISIGANVLLKWLGETGSQNPLEKAVGVSPPFLLNVVADQFMNGFSQVYQWYLLKGIKKYLKLKFQSRPCPIDLKNLNKIATFWEYDDAVTAPLHGFKGVHDYYQRSSCRQYLKGIAVSTLIIHAKDDPFMNAMAIPEPTELSDTIDFLLAEKGGHVGFISGAKEGVHGYWLEEIIPHYFTGKS